MKTHDDVDIIQMKKTVIKNASWKHTQTFYGESLLQTKIIRLDTSIYTSKYKIVNFIVYKKFFGYQNFVNIQCLKMKTVTKTYMTLFSTYFKKHFCL